jgi:hypothetical protein
MSVKKRSCDQLNEINLYTKRLKLTSEKQIKLEPIQMTTILNEVQKLIIIQTTKLNNTNKILDNKLNEFNIKLDQLSNKLNTLSQNVTDISNNLNILSQNVDNLSIIKPPKNNYQSLYVS